MVRIEPIQFLRAGKNAAKLFPTTQREESFLGWWGGEPARAWVMLQALINEPKDNFSEGGGSKHGGSRPLNRQGLRSVELDGPGVFAGIESCPSDQFGTMAIVSDSPREDVRVKADVRRDSTMLVVPPKPARKADSTFPKGQKRRTVKAWNLSMCAL